MHDVTLAPIGVVRNGVTEPRDAGWGDVVSEIVLDPSASGMLAGLEEFSHVVVVYWMHRAGDTESYATARDVPTTRHPRDDPSRPARGVLAQRARHRPNPIGVTACVRGAVGMRSLTVRGLDALDGTPVLDVKPHVPAFDAPPGAQVAPWMDDIMRDYFHPAVATPAAPAGFSIRSLRASDVPAIHALWTRAGLPFQATGRDSPARLARACAAAPDLALCAVASDVQAPGLAGVLLATSDGRKGWINRLAVDPRYRHRGLAAALVRAAETAFDRHGLLILTAMAEPGNAASIALFRSLGYEVTEICYLRKSREGV